MPFYRVSALPDYTIISFVCNLDFNLKGGREEDLPSGFRGWIDSHIENSPEYIESMSTTEFVDRLQTFLCQCGFRKLNFVKADDKKIYSHQSGNNDDLVQGLEKLRQSIGGSTKVEVGSATKTEHFTVWINTQFMSKHRERDYSIVATATCIPNNLLKLEGESDYRHAERLEPFTAEMNVKSQRAAYIERQKELLEPLILGYGDNLAKKFNVSVERLDIEESGRAIWNNNDNTFVER